MKKIGLFLEAEPHFGGMFQYSQSILDALSFFPRKDYTVLVVYTKKDWVPHLKAYNFQTSYVRSSRPDELVAKVSRVFFLRAWRSVSQYVHPVLRKIRDEKCDLWIFPTQNVYSYQTNVPALTAIHDLMHRYEKFPEITDPRQYASRERLFSNIVRYSKAILVDSECGKRHVVESYAAHPDKIFALPYTVPKYISANQADCSVAETGLPPKYLFYPAQFWEHKNHPRLLRALAEVKKAFPDVQLVLAGSKKNGYAAAVRLVDQLDLKNNVTYLGYVADQRMPGLYQNARALVMPTFFGPTNIPPLEAFALGCPVAISGIYGMPEQCGDAAVYFDPLSVEDMAAVVRKIWSEDALCQLLAEKGWARSRSWQIPQFSQRLREIVEHVV